MALRGNLLVAQSGGPTAVINASLLGIVEQARQQGEIERILGARFGLVGIVEDDLIDLGAEDPDRLRSVGRSPAAAMGSCRLRFNPSIADSVLDVLQAHNIRFLLYIGGNDSAETAHGIQALADARRYEIRCLGVPKTIDNDLACMDHTPGYGSIARYVAIAARDCAYDAAAIATTDQVTILEVMGRNAGWVAASAALAREAPGDAPHLIYVPERPLAASQMLQQVHRIVASRGYAVIVVTETVRDEHNHPWARSTGDDGFGHARLVGAAERMCELIGDRLRLKARFNKPGSLQRSAGWCVSPVDWQEAYAAGQAAVSQAVAGARDVMIALLRAPGGAYACTMGAAPLVDVAHAERRLPAAFLGDDGQISDAFLEYARPLIGGALPQYARLAGIKAMRGQDG